MTDEELKQLVASLAVAHQQTDKGIYYAEIHDDIFQLKTPSDFQTRAF